MTIRDLVGGRRLALAAGLGVLGLVTLGLGGSHGRAENEIGHPAIPSTDSASTIFSYPCTPTRLLECARGLQLDGDHGLYVSGFRWTEDFGLVEDRASRDCLIYLGMMESPDNRIPHRFQEAEIIDTILERLPGDPSEHHRFLEVLAGRGQPIRGSTMVAWLESYARQFEREIAK